MIVVLAGGIGGAKFIRGLLAVTEPGEITVIGNTADDITLHGLRVCPDLDTLMYTLGGGAHEEQGWGRADETFTVAQELSAYGEPIWFGLGDRDLATHILRTKLLWEGLTLSAATAQLAQRWKLPVTLIPMTDDMVETHVLADGDEMHFQDYWVRRHAEPPIERVWVSGAEYARPAPGVMEALIGADVILLAPSNPVVSIGAILAIPGVRDALAATPATRVGISPIIGDQPVRGMADKLLATSGVACTAAAVALEYGTSLLDGWLVDETDRWYAGEVEQAGIACQAVPLWMNDVESSAAIAKAALQLADSCRKR